MRSNRRITSALVSCVCGLFFVGLLCSAAAVEAQTDWGKQPEASAPAPAYTPQPDQKIYFRPGNKERSIGVTVTNTNVPGLPYNLNYLKQTIEALEDIGYDVPEDAALAAVQVRVTAKYTVVDNSQTVANRAGSGAAVGAALGALTGFALGGGRGAAEGAAGGAVSGAATGAASAAPVVKYLTLQFDVSSRRGGTQMGRVTKDVTYLDMGLDEFIDACIADYLEVSFPQKR